MDLGIPDDELSKCVQCGLCLPHCPTFRVTGDEAMSPRGRIHLMREVQRRNAPLTKEVVRSFETCVQCRGCETACPSGVPYGHLMERTRESLATRHSLMPRWLRLAFAPLTHPKVLRAGTAAIAVAAKVPRVQRRLGLPPRVPIRRRRLNASGSHVYLFTGCVMDAWQRHVHEATIRVIEAAGFGVAPTGDLVPCCGALHGHAGFLSKARKLATKIMGQLEPNRPILVNSAGCGAAMKEYGVLLATEEAREFSERVFDVSEWLARHADKLPVVAPLDVTVAVQDPCHLRHVQRAHGPVRTLLAQFVRELVELDDEGLCCGAGGVYSVLERDLATQIRDRKIAAIARAAPDLVASANPGCSLHLAHVGIEVLHPMEIIDRALGARDLENTAADTSRTG